MTDFLTHQVLIRQGLSTSGRSAEVRKSSDYLINGESLLENICKIGDYDIQEFEGNFVSGFAVENERRRLQMLTEIPPDFNTGRVVLYEHSRYCHDQRITVRVSCTEESYTWDDFWFEYHDEYSYPIPDVGSFRFEKKQYRTAINIASGRYSYAFKNKRSRLFYFYEPLLADSS